jgi:hypothetical protein
VARLLRLRGAPASDERPARTRAGGGQVRRPAVPRRAAAGWFPGLPGAADRRRAQDPNCHSQQSDPHAGSMDRLARPFQSVPTRTSA